MSTLATAVQHCCRDPKQCSKARGGVHTHTHTHTRASKRYVKCQFGKEELNFLLFSCSSKFVSLLKLKMLRNLQKKKLLELLLSLLKKIEMFKIILQKLNVSPHTIKKVAK